MDTAAIAPIPGSTPIAVPSSTPAKQYIRFVADSATLNPIARASTAATP
jgi:hypothetical protein